LGDAPVVVVSAYTCKPDVIRGPELLPPPLPLPLPSPFGPHPSSSNQVPFTNIMTLPESQVQRRFLPSDSGQSNRKDRAHVVVASIPVFPHVEKLQVIATALFKNGFDVTFATGPAFRGAIESGCPGMSFIPLQGISGIVAQERESFRQLRNMSNGLERDNFVAKSFFVEPMEDQHRTLQSLLEELAGEADDRPVVVLHDMTFLGCAPIFFGAPGLPPAATISISHAPLNLRSVDIAPFNSGFPPDSSPSGQLRNMAKQAEYEQSFSPVQIVWEEHLRSMGVTRPKIPFFWDCMITAADRCLHMSIPSLEYPRSDLPKSLKFVGTIPAVGLCDENDLPSWWNVVLKHEKPLVVATQGSTALSPQDLILPAIEALGDMDVLIVATLENAGPLSSQSATPSNVNFAGFVPFHQLFKHADVVISNGGYGTVNQALYQGVPMVLAGTTQDKPEVCARMAWAGAGINLACQRPEPSAIRDAVERVLKEPRFRARAMELSREYAQHDAVANIAAEIDQVVDAALARPTER
jgi:UDP:flavonoid glycosyltransferase YjiC (YdhE family)